MTLEQMKDFAKQNYVPIIREKSGLFLQEKIAQIRPSKVLEIGTAIGYSGILILQASNCKLTTIEKNKNLFDIAVKNFEEQNLFDRVEALLGDGRIMLEKLVSQGEKFDFIFLDGPKGQYINYLPLCKSLLNVGGVLFADNINHDGLVLSDVFPKHKCRTMILNLRKFVVAIRFDEDFDCQICDIEDGILIAKRKH